MSGREALAIAGGPPAVDGARHGSWPDLRAEDREAVVAVFERGTIWGPDAPEVRALQEEWAQYVGVRHCLALNSGTAALHCGLAAVGVRPGDEVIVPAFSFVASAMAVVHQGARPVFCDIDPRTYNLDPAQLPGLISERTRAIMPVHLHGLPADMAEITAIAQTHGLAVIEDAAQAHGARYRGRTVGGLGDCAAFSLNATKNLCGGEGGLFVADDPQRLRIARRLSMFGEDLSSGADGRAYRSHGIGWNYRYQELSAALARSQLRRLDDYNATAQVNASILTDGLRGIAGITPPYVPDDRTSVFHKYRVRIEPAELGYEGPPARLRDWMLRALRAEGVAAVLWQPEPMPAQPAFRRPLEPWHPRHDEHPLRPWDPAEYPHTSRLLDCSLVLGSQPQPLFVQHGELMKQYVEAVAKVAEHLRRTDAAAVEPAPSAA
jgi:dTDP-4-amino-4,6-dideoxygalactose transaminase